MPNATAVTLTPSTLPVTASGNSDSVDIGTLRKLVVVDEIIVTAVAGTTPTLDLRIETSANDSNWEALDSIDTIEATGTYSMIVDQCKRYIRLAWTVTGSGASFTFSAVGTAHTIYATQADMSTYGHNENALAQAKQKSILESLLAASSVADDYLSSAYELPLASWGSALSSHVARMATHILSMTVRQLYDEVVEDNNSRAIKYLTRIANGDIRPKTIVDSTPEVKEDSAYVVSATSRGW